MRKFSNKITATAFTVVALVVIVPTSLAESAGLDAIIETVALPGDAAPDTGGATFFTSGFGVPVLNNEGDTAFVGGLTGPGVTSENSSGIFKEGSSLTLVVRTGDIAPGTGGQEFITLGVGALNDWGNIAFGGTFEFNVFRSHQGIWKEVPSVGGSDLEAVALEVGSAPVPGGATFGGPCGSFSPFPGGVAFNNEGNAAFLGKFCQSNGLIGTGIFQEGSNLQLVVRDGDIAPGSGGDIFGGDFSSPALNNFDEFAFSGSWIGTSRPSGIWKGVDRRARMTP